MLYSIHVVSLTAVADCETSPALGDGFEDLGVFLGYFYEHKRAFRGLCTQHPSSSKETKAAVARKATDAAGGVRHSLSRPFFVCTARHDIPEHTHTHTHTKCIVTDTSAINFANMRVTHQVARH